MGIEFPSSARVGDDVINVRTADGIKGKKAEALTRMLADGDLNDNIAELGGNDGSITAAKLVDAGFDPMQANGLATKLNGAKARGATPSLARQFGGRDAVSLDEVVRSRSSFGPGGLNGLPSQLKAIADPMQRDAAITEISTDAAALSLRADTLAGASDTTRKCWTAMGLPQRHDESGINNNGVILADFASIPSAKALGDWCHKRGVSKEEFAQAVISHPDIPINARKALLTNLGVTDGPARITSQQKTDLAEIQRRSATISSTLGASTPCQTLTLATGDGTGTAGIAGRRNVGAGYFQTPDIQPSHRRVFQADDDKNPVVMRFNAVGVDANSGLDDKGNMTPNSFTMRVGGQTIAFNVFKNDDGSNDVVPSDPEQFIGNKLVDYNPETNSLTIAPGAGPIAFEQHSTLIPDDWNRPDSKLDADEFQVSVTTYNANSVIPELPRVALPLEDTFAPDKFTTPDLANNPAIKDMAKYLQQFPVENVKLSLTGVGAVNMVDGKRTPTATESDGYGADAESRPALRGNRHADVNGTVSEDRKTLDLSVSASTDHVRSSLYGTIAKATGDDGKAAQATLTKLKTANPSMTANQLLSALRSIAIEQAVRKELTSQGVDTSAWPPPAATVGKATISLADFQTFSKVNP